MKDFTTLRSEIKDPSVKRKLDAETDRLKAERALNMFHDTLGEALDAHTRLPAVEAELAALRKAVERPINASVTVKPPAKVKGTVKRPNPVDAVFQAGAAELKRFAKHIDPDQTLNELIPGDEYKLQRQLARKSAVNPATTTSASWLAEIVQSDVLGWIETIAPVSVFGQMMTKGGHVIPFGNNNSVTMPGRAPGADVSGSFVGQGATLPVKADTYNSVMFTRFKAGVISLYSAEALETSTPSIEKLLREHTVMDTGIMLDGVLLNPANAAIAGIRPASPWNGAATQPSAGTDVASIIADVSWLLAAISINGQLRKPCIVIDNARALRLSMIRDAAGWVFRDDLREGHLMGTPLIVSANCPVDTVYAADLDDMAGWLPAPAFDVSATSVVTLADDDPATTPAMQDENAINDNGGSIHVSDAAGDGATTVSTFQINAYALRTIQMVSWGTMRSGTTAYLTAVTW